MLSTLKTVLQTKHVTHMCNKLIWLNTSAASEQTFYKLVIAGGGTGGITMAAKLSAKFGKGNVAIIEPSDVHYYQPYWTLVGGGIVDFQKSYRKMDSLIPKGVVWLQDSVISFHPKENMIKTKSGKQVEYDYLIIALGMKLGFEKIKGLPEAFDAPGVCSNYSPDTVQKTIAALKNFQSGNAIFTQPLPPIKCAGAPQKIAYLADDYLRQKGKRDDARMIFCTAMNKIFSVPKYAEALSKIAESKDIEVYTLYNLVEVKPHTREAVFLKLQDRRRFTYSIKYELLHVTPPMFPPDPISKCKDLRDESGYLHVNTYTLQHLKFSNIFGIGDCTNLPTSKTAAAVAAQCAVLDGNIRAVMSKKALRLSYDGYTSCPLVTGNQKAIIAEFDYDLKPMETLPFDQSKEKYIHYIMKKDVLPFLYWNLMLRGKWNGPGLLRSIFHPGM